MFRILILAVAALGVSRFVWGIRQGYKGLPIQHPGDETSPLGDEKRPDR